jgi:hypothetical protein
MALPIMEMGKVINPPTHFIAYDRHTPIGFCIDPFANRDAAVSTLHLTMLAVIGEEIAKIVSKTFGLGHDATSLRIAGDRVAFGRAVCNGGRRTSSALIRLRMRNRRGIAGTSLVLLRMTQVGGRQAATCML